MRRIRISNLQLKTIDIFNSEIANLIEYLDIDNCDFDQELVIQNFANLEKLEININSNCIIINLPNLKYLTINSDNNITLLNQNKIKTLDIYNTIGGEIKFVNSDLSSAKEVNCYLKLFDKLPKLKNLKRLYSYDKEFYHNNNLIRYNLYKLSSSFNNQNDIIKFFNYKKRLNKARMIIKRLVLASIIKRYWNSFLEAKDKDGISRICYLQNDLSSI